MTAEERAIYEELKGRPGYAYITPDFKHCYVLVDSGLLELTHVDTFENLSDEELNDFISDAVRQLTEA